MLIIAWELICNCSETFFFWHFSLIILSPMSWNSIVSCAQTTCIKNYLSKFWLKSFNYAGCMWPKYFLMYFQTWGPVLCLLQYPACQHTFSLCAFAMLTTSTMTRKLSLCSLAPLTPSRRSSRCVCVLLLCVKRLLLMYSLNQGFVVLYFTYSSAEKQWRLWDDVLLVG